MPAIPHISNIAWFGRSLGFSSVNILEQTAYLHRPAGVATYVLGGDQGEHANGSSPKIQQVRSRAIAQHPKAAIEAGCRTKAPFSVATALRVKCSRIPGPPQAAALLR